MDYKSFLVYTFIAFTLISCSSNKQLIYLADYNEYSQKNIEHSSFLVSKNLSYIQSGDILKINDGT